MNEKLLSVYVAVLAILAGLMLTVLDWEALVQFSANDVVGFITLIGLAVLSQAMAVDSVVGAAKPMKSSIAFLPLLALAVVFPTAAVVAAAGGMAIVSELLIRRDRQWRPRLFNIAQAVLSYGAAGWLFHYLQAVLTGSPLFSSVELTGTFIAFCGLAATLFGMNMFLVSTYFAIWEKQPLGAVLREAAGRGGGNLLYDLLASPVALLVAYLYVHLQVAGLLVVILPLLFMRHSYLSAIRLHKANRDLLRVLIKAIETRDPYTSGHSLRVSNLARLIAEDHGLRSGHVHHIETAALLHDIGKIDALYTQILSKESALTDYERALIQTHATKGADILHTLTSLDKEVIAGVRHHHERYDGSGYPAGLSGKSIPLAARIIMLCDSVDAMLSDRPYRPALPVFEVRQEIQRCAGTQFDPDLVTTILDNGTLERAELLVDRSDGRTQMRAVLAG